MDFKLTEERQMLQDSLRRYLLANVTHETMQQATESELGFDQVLWDGLVEMGISGAMFPEERGGFGGGGYDVMVVFEELGRAGAVTPLLETAVLAGALLSETGRFADVEEIIGGRVLTFAHGEPRSRYDLSHVETVAEMKGDSWHLSGSKAVIHHAAAADILIVSARTSGDVDDEDGISLFVVPAGVAGVRAYPLYGGGRAAEVTLDCSLPASSLIGEEGRAFDSIKLANARATAAQCAEALGLMETIKSLTVDYLRQRRQFGQPIGKFQALQHRMADILIEIEQARSAVINLCGHLRADENLRELHVSAAKNLIARAGKLVAEEAIQMHGGIGMTQEYALGHFAKRLTMVDHRFGDGDFHLERFIRLSAA
jgi:alkylation response protein AidB-like acyl-CoA dehydrogenase